MVKPKVRVRAGKDSKDGSVLSVYMELINIIV